MTGEQAGLLGALLVGILIGIVLTYSFIIPASGWQLVPIT